MCKHGGIQKAPVFVSIECISALDKKTRKHFLTAGRLATASFILSLNSCLPTCFSPAKSGREVTPTLGERITGKGANESDKIIELKNVAVLFKLGS